MARAALSRAVGRATAAGTREEREARTKSAGPRYFQMLKRKRDNPEGSSGGQPKGTVSCKNCGKTIVIDALPQQLTEFSAKCDHCGKRSFYTASDVNVPSRR
jgi:hypothetical protein